MPDLVLTERHDGGVALLRLNRPPMNPLSIALLGELRDAALALAVEGADLLIYDATFTEAEMPAHRGWGHSTWEAGLRLKQRAGVKLLALAHHHPDRTDVQLDALAEAATKACSNVFFARQGLSLSL